MDTLQRYLIEHPELARSYARLWETILRVYPHVATFTSPRQWDQFLHQNEHTINQHLTTREDVLVGEVKRAGEMLWYYGPAALSSPVQAAIRQLDENLPDHNENKKGKEKKENQEEPHDHFHGAIPIHDDLNTKGKITDTKTIPEGKNIPHQGVTVAGTIPIVAAATAQSPQALASQKIQQAASEGIAQSAAARIDEAKTQAPQTPQERINQAVQTPSVQHVPNETARRIEEIKPPQPKNTSFITPHGQTLFTPPSTSEDRGLQSMIDEDGNLIQEEKEQEQEGQQSQAHDLNKLRENMQQAQKPTQGSSDYPDIRTRVPHTSPQSPQPSAGSGSSGDGQPPQRPRNRRRMGAGGIKNIARIGRTLSSFTRVGGAAGPIIAFFSSPPGWITLLIAALVIIILIIFFIISNGFGTLNKGDVNVTITKTGPTEVPNPTSQDVTKSDPSDIAYLIKVTWSGGPSSITVTDKIPDNTEFVSAGNGGSYNETSRTVTWNISGSGGNASSSATPTPTPVNDPRTQVRVLDQFISPTLQDSLKGIRSTIAKTVIQEVHAATVDISKYFDAPYYIPPPNGDSDVEYSDEAMNNANTLGAAIAAIQPYLLTKYPATHVDPFLAVMWTMAIEGSGADPYFWNCNETYHGKENISRGCRGWYNSGNWQVGYGIQVSQAASHLVEDFDAIYGRSDASIVQEVGNRVIQGGGITNPSSMPAKSVAQLVQEAGRPGTIFQERPTTDTEAAAQQAIAILLMDPKIGAASIAQEVAGDIGSNWVASMKSWGQSYYINGWDPSSSTFFSNRIKLLAEKYTGVGGAIGGGLGSGSQTLSLILRPKDPDSWVINYVTANAIGGGGGSGSYVPSGTADAQCTPPGGTSSNPEFDLSSKYNIRTEGFSSEGVKKAYEMLTCLSGSKFPTYLSDVTTTIHNAISPSLGSIGMDCDGNTCNIWIPENTNAFKFILTHEFGHVIYYTNSAEEMHVSEFENAWTKEGGLSPYSGPYYGGQGGCRTTGSMVEDYAEMVAYYYNPTQGGKTGACDSRDNPKNSLFEDDHFPLHLEVAKKVL